VPQLHITYGNCTPP